MKKAKYLIIIIVLLLIVFTSFSISKRNKLINQSKEFQTPYTHPYLPTEFNYVEGTSLNTGLVIEDSKGNQYVWIEVPKTIQVYQTSGLGITKFSESEYITIEKDLHAYTEVYRNKTSYVDEYPEDKVEGATGLTKNEYTELKQKMLKSVYQNGGFYVGRYETGTTNIFEIDDLTITPTETPVIKDNMYPYGWVTCSEAQNFASSMESGEYVSSLMFGVQWDLVLKYLETKGSTQDELNIDSTNWGNHYNSLWSVTNINTKYYTLDLEKWENQPYGEKSKESKVLLSTGSSDTFMKQNIYDLAGNSWEFTLEYSGKTNSPCSVRGGSYGHSGKTDSASYRVDCSETMYFFSFGFRVSLY